ncbi:MAG: hypothetical protein EHM20_04220 [Alphaproteobacteria bacterium]|nr:MAG: hypothetical protein EHM20_04220 [Alphaproteobacteria bacterium]
MDDENVAKAREIIAKNRYLTLATSFHDIPWSAPVAYVVDDDYNFYFYSEMDSIHCTHLRQNLLVAFAIFDSTAESDVADGLQIAGKGNEVERHSLARVTDLYWRQSFVSETVRKRWMRPDEDFHYPANKRFYRIVPNRIYKLDQLSHLIDQRIEIALRDLIKYPAHT